MVKDFDGRDLEELPIIWYVSVRCKQIPSSPTLYARPMWAKGRSGVDWGHGPIRPSKEHSIGHITWRIYGVFKDKQRSLNRRSFLLSSFQPHSAIWTRFGGHEWELTFKEDLDIRALVSVSYRRRIRPTFMKSETWPIFYRGRIRTILKLTLKTAFFQCLTCQVYLLFFEDLASKSHLF